MAEQQLHVVFRSGQAGAQRFSLENYYGYGPTPRAQAVTMKTSNWDRHV
jgi:hypothetical protein